MNVTVPKREEEDARYSKSEPTPTLKPLTTGSRSSVSVSRRTRGVAPGLWTVTFRAIGSTITTIGVPAPR